MSTSIPCEICGETVCQHEAQDVIDFLRARVRMLEGIILAVAVSPTSIGHPILDLYNEAVEIRSRRG